MSSTVYLRGSQITLCQHSYAVDSSNLENTSFLSAVGSTQAFAAYNGTPKKAVKTVNEYGDGYVFTCDQRCNKHGYSYAGCDYVRPCGRYDEDNFTRIRVTLHKYENGRKTPISNEVVLTEGCGNDLTKVKIKDNQLYVKNIYFGWIGNSPKYSAEARVLYDAY